MKDVLSQFNVISFLVLLGRTKGCTGDRLRIFGDGHGRGSRGSLERSTILGEEKFQKSRGKDPAHIRKPDAIGTSEHRQIP